MRDLNNAIVQPWDRVLLDGSLHTVRIVEGDYAYLAGKRDPVRTRRLQVISVTDMTDERLGRLEALWDETGGNGPMWERNAVPALIAEVRRLRVVLGLTKAT